MPKAFDKIANMFRSNVVQKKSWVKVSRHVRIDDRVIDDGELCDINLPARSVLNIYDGEEQYRESLAKLTDGQIHVVTTDWHRVEVNNGGHCQFYINSAGIVWREAIAGYKAMGHNAMADILNDAVDCFGGNISLDRNERIDQIESKGDDLNDLDDRFFALENEGQIDLAVMSYIRSHRTYFYFDGEADDYELV
jgi:hypothetical protein